MESLTPSAKIYLSDSKIPHAGRGVFALVNISAGEIIEICPVMVLSFLDMQKLNTTILGNYYFEWGEGFDQAALAYGFGSFYNHSYHPNAVFTTDLNNSTIKFTALQDIPAGTEITFNYNGDPNDQSPAWNFTANYTPPLRRTK